MGHVKVPAEHKLSQKVVSQSDVLQIRRAHWVWCQKTCLLIVVENRDARRTKTRNNKLHKYRINIASLMVSASATYSTSVIKSVPPFCDLENQHTHAPAHITAPPRTASYQRPCWQQHKFHPRTLSPHLTCLFEKQHQSHSSKHGLQHTNLSYTVVLPSCLVGTCVSSYRSYRVHDLWPCIVRKLY